MKIAGPIAALSLIGAACGSGGASSADPTAPPAGSVMHFADTAVAVEVAGTESERSQGLMNRPRLDERSGMLFVFPKTQENGGFWMKNTLIPLSIAFFERPTPRIFEVVAVLDMEPCHADPCHVYQPGVPFDAALEVNKGWFAQAGIVRGDTATITEALPEPK